MLFLLFWSPAHAACRVAATGLNFGAYDVFAPAPLDTTGSVTVTCDQRNRIDVTVSIGPSPTSGGFNPRQMRRTSGTNRLNYNLYTTNGYASVWGDGTSTTATVGGTGAGLSAASEFTHTVYGKLPNAGNEDAPVGNYADSIQVTVEY